MNNKQLVQKLINVANNYKTLYVMGCFGSPMNPANKKKYCNNHSYNTSAARRKMINSASVDTFGFDCVCLIKGILWGWSGDVNKTYGGASYSTNGVPDISANQMITKCSGVSTNFSSIEVGEALWMDGHIGVYIGNGLAVECTPSWKNCVQITAVLNIGAKKGYNGRKWTKHGKLPYITYEAPTAQAPNKKSNQEIAQEVVDGKWDNGDIRKYKLLNAGYDPNAIQILVNLIVNGNSAYGRKSDDEIAREVIEGKWGNGNERKAKLANAGYNPVTIQMKVNKLSRK